MNASKQLQILFVISLDLVFVYMLYMIPAISHLLSVPLYKIEPMRCMLLLNLLFTGSKRNAYVMAVTLPLFSFFVGGHPLIVKAFVMAIELILNIFIFDKLSNNMKYGALTMFIAIIASKLFYYIIKMGCVVLGLMDAPIVSTSLFTQLIVVVGLALLFCLYPKK